MLHFLDSHWLYTLLQMGKINMGTLKCRFVFEFCLDNYFEDYMFYILIGFITLLQMAELSKLIRELKSILYGNSESEPVTEACAQLTQEFFKENTLRLLIICLPKLNLEVGMKKLED